MSKGHDSVAIRSGGGALQRRCHGVRADQAGDDDGGGGAKGLARQVDRLDGLLALQLLDVERVAVEAANEHTRTMSQGIDAGEERAQLHTGAP